MPDPLLLIPGLLCDEALWRPQIDHFAGRVDCIVGDTTKDDTAAGMAARILSKAPPRFQLAGLSMGGYIVFEILRRASDRVSKLALLDTQARPDSEEQKEKRKALMRLAEIGRFKGVTPRLLPMLVHEDRLQDTALTEVVIGMAERIGRDAFLRQQNAILTRSDSRPMLPGLAIPTLIICGQQDALTPPDRSQEMAAAIPLARLELIDRCGHLASIEHPERVNTLFDEHFA
ncbi:alpha/beta fold hydrolase [Lacibacterium aquatile]|uniref:Alpha/beta fold hydrolase n=1 Tax=Lacibacterium aquatile TaxID=1168082 RepID=A0ABW5DQ88_9PROT